MASDQRVRVSEDLWRAVSDFLDDLGLVRQLDPKSIEAYASDLQLILNELADGGPCVPVEVWTTPSLQKVMERMINLGYSPRSVERMLTTWRQFGMHLIRLGVLDANPARELVAPTFVVRPPVRLDRAVLTGILDTLKDRDAETLRDRALLELLVACGLRVSELARLRLCDFRSDHVHVREDGRRSRARDIPLSDRARRAVEDYIALVHPAPVAASTLLFRGRSGAHLSARTIQRTVQLRFEDAFEGMRITPKAVRHAYVLWLLEEGRPIEDVQRLAGHLRTAATQRFADHSDRPRTRSVTRSAEAEPGKPLDSQ